MRHGTKYIIIIIVNIFSTVEVCAQLSPGDLTRAHANLEGIRNCTQCHTIGEKISNDKCLTCHKEIESRVSRRSGYHASSAVRGKDCADCHSEHHGRNFDMVRFDESSFNHHLTGYELTGAHQKIDCRQCHIPEFIEEPELKKRKETFLGLSRECSSCHEDYHQNTLSGNCASCHNTVAFEPATNFNHDKSDFPLAGQHKQVECIECHKEETRNGRQFQVFKGLEFANCNDCHSDAHNNNLGTNCKQCHNEQSFSSLSRLNRFNHSNTGFPLKGAHQQVNCAGCHNLEVSAIAIFQDRSGIQTNNCVSCHSDVHEGKFGFECAECHTEKSFQTVRLDNFNHMLTGFELLGKHEEVDCRQCHAESFTEPLPHNECAACHLDYHEGEFNASTDIPDCAKCHTEEGFDVTLFTLEMHNQANFVLDGAHIATPCFACHLNEEKWRFRSIGERCADCHKDVHEGFIPEKYYPDKKCTNCHTTANWADNHFNHNETGFELEGMHAETSCMQCHSGSDQDHQNNYSGFVNLSGVCASCHENTHGSQFEINGITDCSRCHGFESWNMTDFNHDKTAFKLEGRHAEITCEACHKPVENDGNILIQYKFEKFECIDCHQ